MAALLTAASANGAGAGVSLGAPSTVYFEKDSVFDGARVLLQAASTDTEEKYATNDAFRPYHFVQHGVFVINIKGAYYLRAVIENAGPETSINCVVIEGAAGGAGADGADGSVTHTGTGDPVTIFNDGDYYFEDNGDVWLQVTGAWVYQYTILGPTGPDGADGADGLTADHITLTNTVGDTLTYTIYADVGETIILGTFDVVNGSDGATGDTGATGAAGLDGSADIIACCSDEVTDLTTGDAKVTFRMPYAMTLTGVRASVTTAPTDATIIVDINEGGVSILSTLLTIDATEKTSTTAAVPVVISDSSIADDAEITIDIDQVGSTIAGTGLKVSFLGAKT